MLHEPKTDAERQSAGGDLYDDIVRLRSRGELAALATIVETIGSTPGQVGMKLLVTESGDMKGTIGGGCVEAEVFDAAREVARDGRARLLSFEMNEESLPDEGLVCGGEVRIFIEPIAPPTLLVFGAGHVGKVLTQLAAIAGFRVEIADDREEYVSSERFPAAAKRHSGDWIAIFEKLAIPESAYVVIATRGHQHDATVLRQVARFRPRYVGMLGSRRKAALIYEALESEGIDREWLQSVHSPVGLSIGAKTHEEICVSIVAELIAQRRQ
ncbi:MAG: XdhC/CoxI family protein [Planctomycetota bacterium]